MSDVDEVGREVGQPVPWAQLRRDLFPLLASSDLGGRGLASYAYLLLTADYRTRVAISSAPKIRYALPDIFSTDEQCKRTLKRLRNLGLIDWYRKPGKKGAYAIEILGMDRLSGVRHRSNGGDLRSAPRAARRGALRDVGRTVPRCDLRSDSPDAAIHDEIGPLDDSVDLRERLRETLGADPRDFPRPTLRDRSSIQEGEEEGEHTQGAGATPDASGRVCVDPQRDENLKEWNAAGAKRRTSRKELQDEEAALLQNLRDECGGDAVGLRRGLKFFFDDEDVYLKRRGWDFAALRGRFDGVVSAVRAEPSVGRYAPSPALPKRTEAETPAALAAMAVAGDRLRQTIAGRPVAEKASETGG